MRHFICKNCGGQQGYLDYNGEKCNNCNSELEELKSIDDVRFKVTNIVKCNNGMSYMVYAEVLDEDRNISALVMSTRVNDKYYVRQQLIKRYKSEKVLRIGDVI